MPSFADIQHEIANILSVADEDLTDEQKALFNEYADELAEQEEDKIDGFVFFIRAQQARARKASLTLDKLTKRYRKVTVGG